MLSLKPQGRHASSSDNAIAEDWTTAAADAVELDSLRARFPLYSITCGRDWMAVPIWTLKWEITARTAKELALRMWEAMPPTMRLHCIPRGPKSRAWGAVE